eukprot:g2127.t1
MNLPPGLGGYHEEEKESIPKPTQRLKTKDGRRTFEYHEDEEDDFALIHQSDTVSETLIGKKERDLLRCALHRDERLLFGTIARLYAARPDPNIWSYTGIMGALILVFNRRFMSLSFQFREADHLWCDDDDDDDENNDKLMKASRYRLLWQAELSTSFLNDYEVTSRKFHVVDLEAGVFGFSFAFSVDAMIFDRWCRVVGRQYVSDSDVKLLNNLTSRADKISRQFRTEILFRRKKRRRNNTGKHHRPSVDDDEEEEEEELSPKRRRSSPLTLSAHSALLLREFGIAQHHMHNHDTLSGVVNDLDTILRDRSKLLSSDSDPKSSEKKVKKKKRRSSFTTVYELLRHRRRSSTSSSLQSKKSDERAAKEMRRWSQTHLKRHQDSKKTNERHLHASRRTRRAARSAASVSLVASQDAAYAVERSRLSIVALTCAHASRVSMYASRAAHYASRACALEVATWGISRQESMRASAKASRIALKASINARVKSRVAEIICTRTKRTRSDMKIWIEERVPLRERNRRATYVFNENTNQEKRTSKSIRRLSGVGTISSSTKYLLANAALKIQKVYRGFRDRQYTGLSLKVRKLQISARIIQRAFRNARTKLRDRHHADPVMAHVVLMKMSSKIDRKIGETCRVCAQVALQASRDALKAAHNALLHAEDTYQRKQRVEIVKRVTQYASFVSLIAAEAAETSANKALAYVRSCRQQIFASQCVLDATRVANAALNDAEKAARDGFFAIQTALAARDGAKSVARHAALAAYYSAKAAKTCFEDIKPILTLYRRTERARRVAQKASKWAYNAATVATLALALVALRKSVVNNVKVWLKGDTEMNRVETFLLESVNVQDPKRVQLIKNLARVCYQTLRNDETITQHPFRYLLVENISKLDKLPIPHPPPPAAPLKGSRPRAKAESSVFVHTSSHDSDNIAEEIPMPPPPPSKREESVPRPPPSTEESIPVPPPPRPPQSKSFGLDTTLPPPPPPSRKRPGASLPSPCPPPDRNKLIAHFTSTNVLLNHDDSSVSLYNNKNLSSMDMRSEAELATSISFIDTRPGAMMFEQSLKADHRFVDTFGSFTESMNIILESAKMAGEIDMQFFLSGRFSEHVLEPPVREIESIGSPRSILRRRLSDQIEAFGNRYYQNDDDDDESWDSEEEEEDD